MIATIALLLAVAAAGPTPPPDPPLTAPGTPPAVSAPPGGDQAAAADDALLRSMRASYVALIGERGRAHRTLGELNAARYDLRLSALDGPQGGDEARARLVTAWYKRYEAVSGPQRVDPRAACRLQERALREALVSAGTSQATGRLAAARGEAGACLARLQATLRVAARTGAELDAVLVEARTLLAATGP